MWTEDGGSTFSWHRRPNSASEAGVHYGAEKVGAPPLRDDGSSSERVLDSGTAITFMVLLLRRKVGLIRPAGRQQKRPQHRLRPRPGQARTAPGSPAPAYGRSSCPVTAKPRLSKWFIHPLPVIPIWGRLSSLLEAFNVVILHRLRTVPPAPCFVRRHIHLRCHFESHPKTMLNVPRAGENVNFLSGGCGKGQDLRVLAHCLAVKTAGLRRLRETCAGGLRSYCRGFSRQTMARTDI